VSVELDRKVLLRIHSGTSVVMRARCDTTIALPRRKSLYQVSFMPSHPPRDHRRPLVNRSYGVSALVPGSCRAPETRQMARTQTNPDGVSRKEEKSEQNRFAVARSENPDAIISQHQFIMCPLDSCANTLTNALRHSMTSLRARARQNLGYEEEGIEREGPDN
jgi:hypothetical protein